MTLFLSLGVIRIDAAKATGTMSDSDWRDVTAIGHRRMAREINPLGVAPVIFAIGVGVLAILRGQHLAARSIIAAIEANRSAPADIPFGR